MVIYLSSNRKCTNVFVLSNVLLTRGWQWYAGKCLETSFQERKEKSLLVFVDFCGVNIPSMVAFKLPMISLVLELGSRAGTSSGSTPLRSTGISVCTSALLYAALQRNLLNSTTYLTTFFPPNGRHYAVPWKIGDKVVSDAPSAFSQTRFFTRYLNVFPICEYISFFFPIIHLIISGEYEGRGNNIGETSICG